jgi:hypothetical protein
MQESKSDYVKRKTRVDGACETPKICEAVKQKKISKVGNCWFTLSNPPHPKDEVCKCQGYTVCGYCYWTGIVPEQVPECRQCASDLDSLTAAVRNVMVDGATIEFTPKCKKNCLWFDWFQDRRNEVAKANGVCVRTHK